MPQNVCTVHEDKAYLQAQIMQKIKDIGLDKKIILPISFSICLGCSKEPSHWDGSFEYP